MALRRSYCSQKNGVSRSVGRWVAHEINDPIGFCLSNLNTLRDYVEVFAQLADFVEQSAPSFEGSEFYQAWMRFKQQHDLAFVREDVLSLVEESASGLHRVKDIVTSLQSVSHSSDGRLRNAISTTA